MRRNELKIPLTSADSAELKTPLFLAGTSKQPVRMANSQIFWQKKPLRATEKCIQCCVNIPCSCYPDRTLREGIREGKYTIEKPLLAYRCDTRRPEEIFNTGFSAYSFGRAFNHAYISMCCSDACHPVVTLLLLFPLIDLVTKFLCMPTVYCGQSLYSTPYVSTWSALALSTRYEDANSFMATSKEKWRYIVYLDGAINFSEFSNFAIRENLAPAPDEDSIVYDASEIFPRDEKNQTVSSGRIIAAIRLDEPDNKKFIFNKKFSAWDLIEGKLIKAGLNINTDFPSLEIGFNDLGKILTEVLLTEETLALPPPRQTMK